MKLPRNFGGQGYGNMMQQMQSAMSRAETLETELAAERLEIDKGPVKATFTGTGELLKLSIDKSIIDPNDSEMLEDLIVSAVKDGFSKATEIRQKKVNEILPNVPNIPGIS